MHKVCSYKTLGSDDVKVNVFGESETLCSSASPSSESRHSAIASITQARAIKERSLLVTSSIRLYELYPSRRITLYILDSVSERLIQMEEKSAGAPMINEHCMTLRKPLQ